MRAREWLQPWNGGETIATDEMTETICQVGTKSHIAHDELLKELSLMLSEKDKVINDHLKTMKRLTELEAFKKYADMTPRVLADRVLRLERALKVLSDRYIKIGGKL